MNQTMNADIELTNASCLSMTGNFSGASPALSRHTIMWKAFGIFLLALAQLTFGAPEAHAATISCSSQSGLNFAPMLDTSGFGRDAAIGGNTPNYSTPVTFNCQGDPNADRDIFLDFQASPATLAPGYTDVFATNISSVGVRYTISNGAGTSCNSLPVTVTTGTRTVTCHQVQQAASPGQTYTLTVSAQFVKLANGIVGQLTTIPVLSLTNRINNQGGSTLWGNVFTGSASGAFSTLTCSVTTPSVVVPVSSANINRLTSIGSTDGTGSVNIGLNCNAGVKAYMTLTDATTPSNTSNTLTLASDSVATGVGFQLLYNDNPVSFGPDSAVAGNLNQFSVMASPAAGGPVNIPFTARFIRTGTVTPGLATANATFTMSYQ
ncbi:fimbrial protein [Paraburkholderia nemoris]|uniref:fimbrial protein n=1 Tax=Paraburkholderia nemoris TaxID=2793076 RepID=UPI0038B92DAA